MNSIDKLAQSFEDPDEERKTQLQDFIDLAGMIQKALVRLREDVIDQFPSFYQRAILPRHQVEKMEAELHKSLEKAAEFLTE